MKNRICYTMACLDCQHLLDADEDDAGNLTFVCDLAHDAELVLDTCPSFVAIGTPHEKAANDEPEYDEIEDDGKDSNLPPVAIETADEYEEPKEQLPSTAVIVDPVFIESMRTDFVLNVDCRLVPVGDNDESQAYRLTEMQAERYNRQIEKMEGEFKAAFRSDVESMLDLIDDDEDLVEPLFEDEIDYDDGFDDDSEDETE